MRSRGSKLAPTHVFSNRLSPILHRMLHRFQIDEEDFPDV